MRPTLRLENSRLRRRYAGRAHEEPGHHRRADALDQVSRPCNRVRSTERCRQSRPPPRSSTTMLRNITRHSIFDSGVSSVSKQWYDALPADLQRIVMDDGHAVSHDITLHDLFLEVGQRDMVSSGGVLAEFTPAQLRAVHELESHVAADVLSDKPQVKQMYDLAVKVAHNITSQTSLAMKNLCLVAIFVTSLVPPRYLRARRRQQSYASRVSNRFLRRSVLCPRHGILCKARHQRRVCGQQRRRGRARAVAGNVSTSASPIRCRSPRLT